MGTILRKKINSWFVILVLGLLLTIVGKLPLSINAYEQCPENASTLPDGASCIIGAPIGPPLWIVGVVVEVIGGIGLFYSWNKKSK